MTAREIFVLKALPRWLKKRVPPPMVARRDSSDGGTSWILWRWWRLILLATVIFLFSPRLVFARVVINEVLPDPSGDDKENEWLELYNLDSVDVTIIGYVLEDKNGKKFTITTENTGGKEKIEKWLVVHPKAKGGFALTNTGSEIKLFEKIDDLSPIDTFSYPSSKEEKSWSRIPDGTGEIFSEMTNLTPGEANQALTPTSTSTPTLIPSPTFTPKPTSTPSLSSSSPMPTPTPTSYSNIYISEFLANPESDNEKVEVGNNNSFSVSLIDWQIDDVVDGGKSAKKFSAEISAGGLYVLELDSGTLNNDGDDVRLLDFDGVEKDKRSYSSSTKGKSWSRDKNSNWCQTEPSFGQMNSDCPSTSSSTSASTSTPTNTPTPTKKPTSTFNLTPTPKSTARLSKEASLSGEILGKEATSSTEIIKFSEATDSALATPSSKLGKKIAGIFLTLGGLSSLAAGIFLLKNKYFKKGMIKLPL